LYGSDKELFLLVTILELKIHKNALKAETTKPRLGQHSQTSGYGERHEKGKRERRKKESRKREEERKRKK